MLGGFRGHAVACVDDVDDDGAFGLLGIDFKPQRRDALGIEPSHEQGGAPRHVELLGRLPEYRTGTRFRVTPVVGVVTPPFDLRRDAYEVERVFEVPLTFLLDPANHQRRSREWQGELRWFFAMTYQEHTIWGATAGMLVNLYRYLAQVR